MSVAQVPHARLVPAVPKAEKPPVYDVVTSVAIKIIKESVITLALGSVVALFVVSSAGLALIISAAIVQFAVSVFFHSLGAFTAYQDYQWIAALCEWITGANFGILTGLNSQTVIHESGHALASMLIYKNPRPLIEVYPFVGGITQFYKTGLTPFGRKLGSAASTCFVVASGPALTLLISSAILMIGMALEKNSELGKYLICWSSVDFLNHASYAYSATKAEPWNLSHDFVHLSIFGLHPVTATIGILAIPILIALGMSIFWKTKEPPAQEQVAAQV